MYVLKAGQTNEARSMRIALSVASIKIRTRSKVRTDCKTNISIIKQPTRLDWSVSIFTEGHNHIKDFLLL